MIYSPPYITEAENGTFLIVFRMTCASACGESFPQTGAEIGVPRAENLASYVYYTPRRLHLNLVRLGIISRVAGPKLQGKGRQINLDLLKIYGLVHFNWQAVDVAAF